MGSNTRALPRKHAVRLPALSSRRRLAARLAVHTHPFPFLSTVRQRRGDIGGQGLRVSRAGLTSLGGIGVCLFASQSTERRQIPLR